MRGQRAILEKLSVGLTEKMVTEESLDGCEEDGYVVIWDKSILFRQKKGLRKRPFHEDMFCVHGHSKNMYSRKQNFKSEV